MKRISKLLLTSLFLGIAAFFNVSEAQKRVSGMVTEDGTNDVMIGVTVVVKGTSTGTITDVQGRYDINVDSEDAVLVFSFLGKKSQEFSVKGLTIINVTMEDDATMLSEVVYIGYMTQKKADLTGSVAMAKAVDIDKNPSVNAMKALQGKLSGVHITTNGGNPAENVYIQVRGLTSLSGGVTPLIVLDGMPAPNLNFRDINAGDIESVQVLKDAASASIYGARASGGVILIQTKKGEVGKTTVEYKGSVSFNTALNRPEMMNVKQYATAAFRAASYDEEVYGIPITSSVLPEYAYNYTWHRDPVTGRAVLDNVTPTEFLNGNPLLKTTETDWMDEIYRTAMLNNHQIIISSGTDKSKSMLSLSYFNNEGTQITTFFKQYSVRFNNEYSLVNNHLKIGENFAASYLQYRDQNETWWAMANAPVVPVYDEEGNWAGADGFDDFTNPVRLLLMNKNNVNNYVKLIGSFYLDLNIWKGISARSQFGVDYGNAYHRHVEGKWSETGGRNSDDKNFVNSGQSHPLNLVWTNTLSYNFHSIRHDLDVVLGQELTRFVQEGFGARREGIYLESRDYAHLSRTTGTEFSLSSSADEYTYLSYFGKANYVFDSKYLLSVTLRRDGSSIFGENNRWGTFPAVSGGWRISNESFMEDVDIISNLKLRAGYGENGSVQGLPRGYTTTPFVTDYDGTSYAIDGNETGAIQSGYRRRHLGNPNLKWETTSQVDLGVDYGFFNQRLTGSFGYYYKVTKDILVQVPYIAAMGEGGEPWINGAKMNNQGIEFEISYGSKPGEDFKYNISLNVGSYKTKLVDLPENVINRYEGDGMNDLVIGRTPNIFYGFVADGIFKSYDEVYAHAEQPGKAIGRIRYKDLDGNGVINDNDRTFIGITDPDFFGGITFDFGYKGFDMNIFFQGIFGNQVYNNWKYETDFWKVSGSPPEGKNTGVRLLDAWSFDNPGSNNPAITNQTTNNENRRSTYYIEDGSYLKLRNVELGYTLPNRISNSIMMQNLRVYASVHNVLTMKKWWGDDKFTSFDPENHNHAYLTPFSLTFGINVTF